MSGATSSGSTKYSIGRRQRWAMNHPSLPRPTDHYVERWDERMPAAAVAPETALRYSLCVPSEARGLFAGTVEREPAGVRLHGGEADGERFGAVIIVVDDNERAAVTCFPIELMDDGPTRSYAWALLNGVSFGV